MSNREDVQAVVEAVNVLTARMKEDQRSDTSYGWSIVVGVLVLPIIFIFAVGK